jgi:hypothetical protein
MKGEADMNKLRLTMLLATSAGALYAQSDSRKASIRGARGETGKCTIEVNVDGVAEIEITGDRANLHTLTGTPANFVRFECTDAVPRYPDDFKFSGIDGRGRQTLIRDPRDNRGIALIRIEDPKAGREGYTFDVEWRGYANSRTNTNSRPGNNAGNGNNGNSNGNGNGNGNGQGGFGGLNRRYDTNPGNRPAGADQAIDVCVAAVRDKASRDYGYRNIDIARAALDDNPGRRDSVVGRFTYRRGQAQDDFEFGCSVDLNNGRVRTVDIRRW